METEMQEQESEVVQDQPSTSSSEGEEQTQAQAGSGLDDQTPVDHGPSVAEKLERQVKSKRGRSKSVEPEVPTYSPNYKYKFYDQALDQKKEFEFDEWAKPWVKDKESEDRLRDLYTRAQAMDTWKSKFGESQNTYGQVQKEHETLLDNIKMLEGHLNQGDLGSFFNTLKIPDQMVYQYVLNKLQYNDLPADQKAQYDKMVEDRHKSMMFERHNQTLQQQYTNSQVQLRSYQLDSYLERPDIKSIVDAYDTRKGKSGSFRERVIREGSFHWNTSQRDLSPEEAVREVISSLDLAPGQEVNQTQTSQPASRPTLPNVQAKGNSPVKKVIKNLDDIRALQRAMSEG